MFSFEHQKDCGDATSLYKIVLEANTTVSDFIEMVLTQRTYEFGEIGIYKSGIADSVCEYHKGTIVKEMPEEYMSNKIYSATASGGWGRMDYLLRTSWT